MVKTSLKQILAAALFLFPFSLFPCGGGYEEAPPTLDYYLQRLPAKSLGAIYIDHPELYAPAIPEPKVSLPDLIQKFSTESPKGLLPQIDEWIVYKRQNYAGPEDLNFLHDMADLAAAGDRPDPALTEYLNWRKDHFPNYKKDPYNSWEKPKIAQDQLDEIDRKLAAAPAALKPYWIYLKGALYFKSIDDLNSEKEFDKILKDYPGSPKAESALFMKARCKFSQSTIWDYKVPDKEKLERQNQLDARGLFESYLKKYPEGRFATDAWGWIGGLDYKAGKNPQALACFIRQIQDPHHPELFTPAVIMCEKILYQLSNEMGTGGLDVIAKEPRLAMGLIYLIVNTTYRENDDYGMDIAQQKEWRKKILPLLAEAVTKEQKRYDSSTWQPAYLLILAHAASDSGEQEEAIKLLDTVKKPGSQNDDLLLLRALVEERRNQPENAILALRSLLKDCPSSPLVPGARFRLAMALKDSGQAGLALVELATLREKQPPSEEDAFDQPNLHLNPLNRDYSGASDEQIDQMIDALLNFAPPDQLKAALEGKLLPEKARANLQAVLLERALAREDFSEVERYAPPQRWKSQFKPMATLKKETAAGSDLKKRAEKMAALAQFWSEARFTLLSYPLDEITARSLLFRSEDALAQYKRLTNALALGYANATEEMDRRDELQHAFDWWMKAADTDPGNPKAPEWLARAQTTLPALASLSYYSFLRAGQTDMPGRSKKIHDRLKEKYPDSKEARELSAYFSLPQVTVDTYRQNFWERSWDANSKGTQSIERLDSRGSDDSPAEKSWMKLLGKIRDLPQATAHFDENEFSKSMDDLRASSSSLRAGINEAFIINFLDDMDLVAKKTGISVEARNAYLALRLDVLQTSCWKYLYGDMFPNRVNDDELRSNIAKARQDNSMAALADFLDFLDIAVVANHIILKQTSEIQKDGNPSDFPTRDFPLMEQLTADFLKKYPDSPKREAAYLLHARAKVLASRGVFYAYNEAWPAVPYWEGDVVIKHFDSWPEIKPPDPQFFEEYLKEFPEGKYRASMENFQAELALRQHDWLRALSLLTSIAENPKAREIKSEACNRLAYIFSRLSNDNERYVLMEALKKNEAARKYLEIYLNSNKFHLPFLKDYLKAELDLTGVTQDSDPEKS